MADQDQDLVDVAPNDPASYTTPPAKHLLAA